MSPPATNSARAPTANPVVGAIPPVAVSADGVTVAVGLAVAVEAAVAPTTTENTPSETV